MNEMVWNYRLEQYGPGEAVFMHSLLSYTWALGL